METDLNKLRDRVYKIACEHGFHDKEKSDESELWADIEGYNIWRKDKKLVIFKEVEK